MIRTVLGVVPLACLLAACGGGQGEGPLGGPGSAVSVCVPIPSGSDVVSADEALRNSGPGEVRLASVELVGAEQLTLVEAVLVPISDRTLIGTRPAPPPVAA